MLPKRFEKMIIDADTILLRAAVLVQQNYVVVTNKDNNAQMEFPTATEFWGHWKNREGGWLDRVNTFLGCFHNPDDFKMEQLCRLHPNLTDGSHLGEAEKQFDYFIGGMKKLLLSDDYEIVVGGKNNFRYDCAKILPYKGGRSDKPLVFHDLKELIKIKYKNKIVVADGMEADDYISIKGWENWQHFKQTNKWKYIISYIDKDLSMIISPYINYDKKEEGVKVTTPEQTAYSFAKQLLTGDITDNIQGLPSLTKSLQDKYKLKNTRGVGPATAEALLEGCNVKQMFERVVEAYKSYYGVEYKAFTTHTGEIVQWNYLNYLQDNAKLLYLLREEGEDYHITSTLDKLGVRYE